MLEVDLRLMKALVSLAHIHPDLFGGACTRHADLLLKRANLALTLEEDKQTLGATARQLVR
ncbi:hypothetical protein D3C78_1901240 [compost metagenome]